MSDLAWCVLVALLLVLGLVWVVVRGGDRLGRATAAPPPDLGDLAAGRVLLPGQPAPADPELAEMECRWCDVNRLMRGRVLRTPVPPPAADDRDAAVWTALTEYLTDVDRTGDQLVPLYLEDQT